MSITDYFKYDFVQLALLAGLFAAPVVGILGAIVVSNRLTFMTGAIAHTAYAGVGVSVFFSLPMLGSVLATTVASAMLIAWLSNENKNQDAQIGALWAIGMSIGILLVHLTPGYQVDLMTYLFGSIQVLSTLDVTLLAGLSFVSSIIITRYYTHIVAFTFDTTFAQTRGLPVRLMRLLILIWAAICIVLLVRMIGLLLVLALLTLPSYIAMRFAKTLAQLAIFSGVLTLIFCLGGILLSLTLNLPASSMIVMLGATMLILFQFIRFDLNN